MNPKVNIWAGQDLVHFREANMDKCNYYYYYRMVFVIYQS